MAIVNTVEDWNFAAPSTVVGPGEIGATWESMVDNWSTFSQLTLTGVNLGVDRQGCSWMAIGY